jgi:hypothetical protein
MNLTVLGTSNELTPTVFFLSEFIFNCISCDNTHKVVSNQLPGNHNLQNKLVTLPVALQAGGFRDANAEPTAQS